MIVKEVAHTDEPIDNYHWTPLSSTEHFRVFQLIVLVLLPQLYCGSKEPHISLRSWWRPKQS